MSYRNRLDQHSELFHHNWTRPKRSKSQVNGHTEMSQTNIILRSNAKAHRCNDRIGLKDERRRMQSVFFLCVFCFLALRSYF